MQQQLAEIRSAGLYKQERTILSPQQAEIKVPGDRTVLNMCANNYLGLADHPEIITAAHAALDRWGYGLASVRFICGTQQIHQDLEKAISKFLGTEDTILYSSCFDANGGLFETLLGAEDAVISDELNHASIIDGIRLCKAARFRYKNSDMSDLEQQLQQAKDAEVKMIATDGVFSMDGYLAKLPEICALAKKYESLVMVDDSHAVGFVGPGGRGTPALHEVSDQVDIITGTLGKALGGASGGYTSGRSEIIEYLRQRSRPYLFSNSISPVVAAGSVAALQLIAEKPELQTTLWENTAWFRSAMTEAGFDILPGEHPIVPVMLGDAKLAVQMADRLLELGVYVTGFSYPVVPMGKARIRVQVSAAHTREELTAVVAKFKQARSDSQVD